jgi:hydrogenase nickel incorporation protein HypB
MIIEVNQSLTAPNEALARQLNEELTAKGVFCLNIVSAPGSGKTALIEKIISRYQGGLRIAVIEGDPHTDLDSKRVRNAGAVSVQINTQGGCHLDAAMIKKALSSIDLDQTDLLIIENVGNLLCPTFWNLGEHLRAVMVSLPEGADKPLKYPEIFLLSQALLINKIDLRVLLKTTVADIRNAALLINPHLQVFPLSCETGEGLEPWCDWLMQQRQELMA